ncbi:MAG: NfeD family protein [Symbiobacteriaceae bacterium]|nr:NfeD family protein [Symbiobacteriaceae bacterium]
MTILWIVVALIAAVVEMATQALVSIWFSVAGVVAFVMAYFNMPLPIQLLSFAVVSIASFLVIRRYILPFTKVKIVPTNVDRIIGMEVFVTKEIPRRGRGEVRAHGALWSARSDDPDIVISEGSSVIVRAIDGATLLVTLIEDE